MLDGVPSAGFLSPPAVGEHPGEFPGGRSMDTEAGSSLAAAASPYSPFSLRLTFELSLIWFWGKL